jgi:hypothetical protein
MKHQLVAVTIVISGVAQLRGRVNIRRDENDVLYIIISFDIIRQG